jgi:hypothetical protein
VTLASVILVAAAFAQEPLAPGGDAPVPPAEPAGGLTPPVLLAPLALAWPASEPPARGPQRVELDLWVGDDGTVLTAEVRAGEPPFTEVARAAALAARLAPARDSGVPVAVRIPLRVEILPPPVSVEGLVRLGGGGGAPVVGARVCVAEACGETDDRGQFVLYGLPVGRASLTVAAPGLRAEPVPVEIAEGEVVSVTLWMVPETVDVGIVGTYRRPGAEVQRRTLDAAALRAMPGTLGDPLRAVANLPGTQRSPLDTGWLLVRGADPLATTVSIDGVRVPLVYHLGGYTSVLHPALIDAVSFLPGGGGARYGRGLAGAVDVETRAPSPTPEVRAGANLVFAGAFAEVPTPVGTFAAAVRRSYLDAALSPFLPADAAASIPRFQDWQARGVFRDDTRLFGLGFTDTLEVAADDGSPARLDLGTQRAHASRRFRVGDRDLLVAPYFAWEHLRFEVPAWERESRRDLLGGGARVEIADPGRGRFGIGAGVDAEVFHATVRTDTLQRTAAVGMPDPWAEVRFGDRDTLVVGMRADTLFVEGQPARVAPGPRVAAHLQLAPGLGLDAEAGAHHQPPPWEILLVFPEGAALELQEAWAGSLRGDLQRGPWGTSLEGFARYSPRVTAFEADGSLGEGEELAWGVEAGATLRLGRFDGIARFGVGESGRREHADDAWVPTLYDQPFTAGFVGSFALPRLWTLAARFRAAGGYAASGDVVAAYDALQARFVDAPLVGGRTEAFAALDVKVSKRWVFRTWRLDLWVDVENVTNHRVPERVVTGFADLPISEMAWGFVTLPVFGIEAAWQGDPRRP